MQTTTTVERIPQPTGEAESVENKKRNASHRAPHTERPRADAAATAAMVRVARRERGAETERNRSFSSKNRLDEGTRRFAVGMGWMSRDPVLVKEDSDSDDDCDRGKNPAGSPKVLPAMPPLHVDTAAQDSAMGQPSPAAINSASSAGAIARNTPSSGAQSYPSTYRQDSPQDSPPTDSACRPPGDAPTPSSVASPGSIDLRPHFEFAVPAPLLSLSSGPAEPPPGEARPAIAASAPTTPAAVSGVAPARRQRRLSVGGSAGSDDEGYATHLHVPEAKRGSESGRPKRNISLNIGFGGRRVPGSQSPHAAGAPQSPTTMAPAEEPARMAGTARAIDERWRARPASPPADGATAPIGRPARRIGLHDNAAPVAAGAGVANGFLSWHWYALMATILVVVIVVAVLLFVVYR